MWRRFSLNRRGAYLKRALRAKESELRELRQMSRLQLVASLIEAVKHLQQECAAWREGFLALHRNLGEALEVHWREAEKKRPICHEWVVCQDEIDEMFDDNYREVLSQSAQGLRLKWKPDSNHLVLNYVSNEVTGIERWHVASPIGVEMHAAYFRRFWFARVDHSVEEILERHGESPEEVLASLEFKAAPLVRVDDTRQIPAEKPLMVLSSETRHFWRSLVGKTGLSVAATGNRHKLSLLSTVHGINPMDGLMQSQAWHKAYDDAIAAGRNPHVFPDAILDLASADGQHKVDGGKEGDDE